MCWEASAQGTRKRGSKEKQENDGQSPQIRGFIIVGSSLRQKRVELDAKILKYEEIRHQIKNGDILLFKGANFGSRIVQKVKLSAPAYRRQGRKASLRV